MWRPPHLLWRLRFALLPLLLVGAVQCENAPPDSRRGAPNTDPSASGTPVPELDAGSYAGTGGVESSGDFGAVDPGEGSAGSIPISVPPDQRFDGGACEDIFPAPLLRPECPEAPELGQPCEPTGLPCLFEDPERADCFRLVECGYSAVWRERTECRVQTSQPASDERCPERGPVQGEPCEIAELVCDFGPCGDGTLVMQCECGRWKTLQGCVFL